MIENTNNGINIDLAEKDVMPGQEIHGIIEIKYAGRFDSVVINSLIENSNDIFIYTSLNGKKVKYEYARISIFREDLHGKKKLEFTAVTSHTPKDKPSSAKFRVAIVQEHKEIVSAVEFVRIIS